MLRMSFIAPVIGSPYSFPLMPGGALFVLIVGLFVVAGGLLGRQIAFLIAGFVAAGVAMGLFAPRLSAPFGQPATYQVAALIFAVILEAFMISVVRRRLRGGDQRTLIIAILTVVALHFFIMIPAFGWGMLWLSVACIVNVGAAKSIPAYPTNALWTVDGALKVLFGAIILRMPL